MLRKIKLYGDLADFIGHKEFDVQVDSLSKAVSFLLHNFPQIEGYMNPKYYQVKVGNYALDDKELQNPIGQEDIHFVPVITGAGRGFGKILLGAALIAGAFFMPVAAGNVSLSQGLFGAAGSFAKVGFFTKAMAGVGLMLTISGVSEMLFPLPKMKEFDNETDPRLSYKFSGTQNTSRAGTPVPIVYGEIITGSVVISGAVDTQQVQA